MRPLPRKTSKPAATRPAAGGRLSNAPASRRGPLPRRKDRPWGWITGGELVTAKPKGGRTRTVPLPDVAAVALAEHLRTYPAGGLVFSSRERRPLNRNYVNSRVWKPALVRAGVEPTRDNGMHALRHYFASVLIDAGESAKAVAEYLGHADPGFTLRVYAHPFPASEDRARRAVDAALGLPADSLRTRTPPGR